MRTHDDQVRHLESAAWRCDLWACTSASAGVTVRIHGEDTTGAGPDADVPDPGFDDTAVDVNDLIEHHLGLVNHIVNELVQRFPRHVDRDEMYGAGQAGLVDAAHRFDPSTGVPFARYASIRIRGAVIDSARSRDWGTRRMRRDLREIDAATHRLQGALHRTPSVEEVAREAGMDTDHVHRQQAAQLTSALLTIDRPVGGDAWDGASLADHVVEESVDWLPEQATERSELSQVLHHAVARLPEELRGVLVAYHFEGRLLRDIAEDMGVTEARASQLRYEALRALQAYFGTLFEDVPAVPDDAPGKRRRAAYVSEARADSEWREHVEQFESSGAERPVRSTVSRAV